jgi:hypothetical protein
MPDAGASLSRIAGGPINPFTFVQSGNTTTQNGTNQLVALQATGSDVEIIGVAPEWTNFMPGTAWQPAQGYPAAVAGQAIRVYGDLENALVMVASGHTVMPDTLLTSDASGYAKPIALAAAGNQWIGARALEGGVAGDVIRCRVYTRPYTKSA